MLDKKTVFILGAGASCPYGYPSGGHLRRRICLPTSMPVEKQKELISAIGSPNIDSEFRKKFENSSTKSIDIFMARNPKLAPVGKCIIAFEIFNAEHRSLFREQAEWVQEMRKSQMSETTRDQYLAKKDFQGGIWYEYLFDRLTAGLASNDDLPDFSEGKVAFITFNYDRSLEYFLYESFHNSFTEVPESQIVQSLKSLKILHIYGQIAPLKWQDSAQGVDYRPPINVSLLRNASSYIRTIYEEQKNPELKEAQDLIKQAEQIFLLGFGYAAENMQILGLPGVIPPGNCQVHGTAFNLNKQEVDRIRNGIVEGLRTDGVSKNPNRIVIEAMDCLELLRNYLN